MQWHPIFAHLLRPMPESHYEVRTGQPVGDLPRQSDVVLLRKASAGPAPFKGLWSRLTPWSVLEYKGPTVSARFDELHDLLELGLGIHRRLNEEQAKANLPELDDPDVSFWYLVNRLGKRFQARLPTYLPGVRPLGAGLWQARLFRHPLFLVSVRELAVERDSLALHVLTDLPDADKPTVTAALKAEPALWPNFGTWLSIHDPVLWREISLMASQQGHPITLDFRPLAEYLREAAGAKGAPEVLGVKEVVEAVGIKQAVEAVGEEQFWAALSPEQREKLRRLPEQEGPPKQSDAT